MFIRDHIHTNHTHTLLYLLPENYYYFDRIAGTAEKKIIITLHCVCFVPYINLGRYITFDWYHTFGTSSFSKVMTG